MREICPERFALVPNPGHGQPGGKVNVRFMEPGNVQLLGNRHEGEQVVVVIRRLVCDECFVSFAHAVEFAVVLQDAPGEDRLRIVGNQPGGGHRVRGFHVSVTVIDSDDLGSVQVPHALCASFPMLSFVTFASSIPSSRSSAVLFAWGFPNEETTNVTFPILRGYGASNGMAWLVVIAFINEHPSLNDSAEIGTAF